MLACLRSVELESLSKCFLAAFHRSCLRSSQICNENHARARCRGCSGSVCICATQQQQQSRRLLRDKCQPVSVSHPSINANSEAQQAALICQNVMMAHRRLAANKLGTELTRSHNHFLPPANSSLMAAIQLRGPDTCMAGVLCVFPDWSSSPVGWHLTKAAWRWF